MHCFHYIMSTSWGPRFNFYVADKMILGIIAYDQAAIQCMLNAVVPHGGEWSGTCLQSWLNFVCRLQWDSTVGDGWNGLFTKNYNWSKNGPQCSEHWLRRHSFFVWQRFKVSRGKRNLGFWVGVKYLCIADHRCAHWDPAVFSPAHGLHTFTADLYCPRNYGC